MAKAKRKAKGKKRVVGKILLVVGILLSMGVGSGLAITQYNVTGVIQMMNFDNEDSLDKVDISEYDTVSDSDIINILVVGTDKNPDEQNKTGASRRSDSMMIATLDMKHQKLKVTSLMRDMYVPIPGHGSQKLNSAYALGGVQLLYKTLADNFGIKADGYAEVNFDAFVEVINAVGGVEATLTESEALHLNDTNYIKRRKYRNVKVGKQILNGYQALGYCRIRHGKKMSNGRYPAVLTASGKGDDYGRTERQRLVMQALLKQVKAMSPKEWMDLVKIILPNVKTDLKEDDIYSYILAVVQMGTMELDQFSLPTDDGYSSQMIGEQQCLVPDLVKNRTAYKNFVYEEKGKKK